MIKISTILSIGLMLGLAVPQRNEAQVSITKIGESLIGNSAQPQSATTPLNLRAHQDDAIVSFNGYQYAAYYSIIGANETKRYVTLGRRRLPAGVWETVMLTDYSQTINDSHRVIAMGICEGDGTIHLAFDHHNNDLRYRISIEGLATNPQSHSWVAAKFNAVQDNLPGQDAARTTGLTYPRFFSKSNGDLQLSRRKGSAIAGKSMLYTYSHTAHLWTSHGVYLDGTLVLYHNAAGNDTKLNGYLNGITYDGDRLHASWVWRTEGASSANNFDFMYAYSDDFGLHWKNNVGQQAGTVSSNPMTYANSPAVKVFDYPEGTGLANQTGQAVDSVGRVHVVQRKSGKFMHLYRNAAGSWVENLTTISDGRYKITTDQNDNVYLIAGSAKVYAATPGNNFTDWSVAYDGDAGRFTGDAMFDEPRMKREGILSILAAKPGSSQEMYSIDLSVSPVAPTSPALTYGNGGTPGSGSPWVIHAAAATRIEVENFDQGVAGTVYHDTTAGNTGGQYRVDPDVDIQDTTDEGGGYNVGWTAGGEWLQYTVDVESAGYYDLIFRYALNRSGNATMQLFAGGMNITGDVLADSTGGFQLYDTVTKRISLDAGLQTLRIHFLDSGVNLNWFELVPVSGVVEGTLFSDAADASVKENGTVVDETNPTTLLGAGGSNPWVDRATVYVFELPDLGTTDNPFATATFSFNSEAKQNTLKDNDLYGLGRRANAEVLGTDYYGQTATPDPNDASLLQVDILTDGTTLGVITTSPAGSSALVNYLNAQYAGGAGALQYVFLRLNTSGAKTGIARTTLTMSEGGAEGSPDTRPRLEYEAFSSGIVEPVLDFEQVAGNFTFLWSEDGFKLQTLTNDLDAGEWFDVPEGSSSPVVIVPTNPVGFFRLTQ